MRDIIAALICATGLPAIVRNTIARKKAAVLLYHDPEPRIFDSHMRFLKRHYNIVAYADVVRAIEQDDWSSLPERMIVVHIDDGYRRNHELMSTCSRLGIKPTVYLCSHIVGTRRRFWSKLMGGRAKHLRLASNRELLEKLQTEAGFLPDREYADAEALSLADILEMNDQFDFQSHGRYHFSLITLDDRALSDEIESSRKRVEEITGRTCDHFSLPYGDFTKREIAALDQAGYKSIRTTMPGWIDRNTDLRRIPILADVPGDISTRVLQVHLTGLPRFCKRLVYILVTKHLYAMRQRRLMGKVFFSST